VSRLSMNSPAYKRYVTSLLLVIYVCNQTDRALFSFLMEPIKHDLGLSDSQLGFVAGPALAVLYTVLGIPIARCGDRSHRVNIMSAAIVVWSCVVVSFAAIGRYWHLVLAQVGVGIGEAGFTAIAISVISDYYSAASERTRAISMFMLGIPIAGVVSSLAAGWINQAYGWRAVFLAAGLPGIFLALLLKSTVEEPPRYRLLSAGSASPDRPPLRAVFTTLWRQRTVRHLAIGQCLANIVICCTNWLPLFFIRDHGMATGELGNWFAVIAGVGGGAGIWLSGYMTSRFGAPDERIKVRLMAVATALIAPTLAIVLWNPSKELALLILIPCQALMFFFIAPTMSLVQALSAPSTRATMASVFIFIQVLAGGVIGIQLPGILSDVLTPILGDGGLALRWSMTATSLLALWAAAHFWLSARTIRSDLADASAGRGMAVLQAT
jgi:MFS family permease